MKRSKQTSKKTTKAESPKLTEVERVPPTPQDMAEGFNRYAKLITERKYNKAGLPNTYDIYERGIRSWRQLTKKYLGIDTPEPEPLPGNDYYAGMVILAQYCSQQAVKLINPETRNEQPLLLSENQYLILKYLDEVGVAVAQCDIESGANLSNKTVSAELKPLREHKLVAPPEGKKRRIGITSEGKDYVNPPK